MEFWANAIVDIVLVALVGGGLTYGLLCGAIKIIKIPFKFFSSFILATIASISLSSTVVMPAIKGPIIHQISQTIIDNCVERDKVPMFFRLMGVTQENLAADVEAVTSNFLEPAVLILSVIITFFFVFIFGKLIIGLVFGLLDFIFNKIDSLRRVSKTVGAILGAIMAFVIAAILAKIFGFCVSLDLFKNVGFLNSFTGGFIFKCMNGIWTNFFGF